MLEDFLKYRLYLKVDDTSDDIIQKFADIIGDIRWVDDEGVNGPFIRKIKDKYICVRNRMLFFTDNISVTSKKHLTLTEFVEYCSGTEIKFKDIDVMSVFTGEYDA